MRKIPAITGAIFVLTITQLVTFNAHAADDPSPIGSIGIRIAQIPAEVAEKPYANVYIINRLQPAVNFRQRLEVFNTSSREFKVSLYPGAATFKGGKFEIAEGRSGNKFTEWIKLTPSSLSVKPGETKAFNVNISPPADAVSLQQFGVIWAEVQAQKNEAGITSVSRVGIRIYVPVGDAPDISILASNISSSTNEIIVKEHFISRYLMEIILFFIFLSMLFLILFLIFFRRDSSVRKLRKENERQLESQWKRERDRRRQIWKNKNRSNHFWHPQGEHEDRN